MININKIYPEITKNKKNILFYTTVKWRFTKFYIFLGNKHAVINLYKHNINFGFNIMAA